MKYIEKVSLSVPKPKRLVIFILLFLFLLNQTFVSYPQSINASITGRITDKESYKPISNVNVFLAYTMSGSSTDEKGIYSIDNIPPGRYTLVISHIGYKIFNTKVKINGADKYVFNVSLKPKVYQLTPIKVTAERWLDWVKNYKIFKKAFIGTSDFARNTFILDSLTLDFNRNEDDLLFAKAEKPLIIINKALGYYIEYNLIYFEYGGDYVKYSGFPKYSFLKTTDPDTLELWKFNRQKAYNGSLRHFLRAICENYFITDKNLNSADYQIDYSDKTYNGYKAEYTDENFLKKNGFEVLYKSSLLPTNGILPIIFLANTNQYLKPAKNKNEMYLKFENYLEVKYNNPNKKKFPEDDRTKVSWIRLEKDSVLIDKLGRYYETFSIKSHGYWATQRLADTLPYEYVYGDSLFEY